MGREGIPNSDFPKSEGGVWETMLRKYKWIYLRVSGFSGFVPIPFK